ncbi:MAG TPA: aldose 1-epimerase [Actinopolymorphaceae bacterium]
MSHDVVAFRGWEIVRLRSAELTVDVVPGKGGDITSVRTSDGTELLWRSPWGLRHRGASARSGDSEALLMDAYPGGWQTVFPNVGPASIEYGTQWGMHGEAWTAPYDWEMTGPSQVTLTTRLVRSPFELRRQIRLDGGRLTVTETARNAGGVPVEAAWGHHVTFGAPFLGSSCRLEVPTGTTVLVDDERDMPASDLVRGSRSTWPSVPGRAGGVVDLRIVPGPGSAIDRLAYLADLSEGRVSLTNGRLGLRATLLWDVAAMPYTWLWYELNATPTFPWYQAVYVLGIEPHTSYPSQGLSAIREKTGTQVTFAPGESRTATTVLDVTRAD